jgi:hypothetical protein
VESVSDTFTNKLNEVAHKRQTAVNFILKYGHCVKLNVIANHILLAVLLMLNSTASLSLGAKFNISSVCFREILK